MTNSGYQECPFCGEEIKQHAIKCKHCQSILNDKTGVKNNQLIPEKQPHGVRSAVGDGERRYDSKATASLIMGIIGFILFMLPLITVIVSGLGLAIGIKSQKTASNNLSKIGIIICSIGLLINLLIWVPLTFIGVASIITESLFYR